MECVWSCTCHAGVTEATSCSCSSLSLFLSEAHLSHNGIDIAEEPVRPYSHLSPGTCVRYHIAYYSYSSGNNIGVKSNLARSSIDSYIVLWGILISDVAPCGNYHGPFLWWFIKVQHPGNNDESKSIVQGYWVRLHVRSPLEGEWKFGCE